MKFQCEQAKMYQSIYEERALLTLFEADLMSISKKSKLLEPQPEPDDCDEHLGLPKTPSENLKVQLLIIQNIKRKLGVLVDWYTLMLPRCKSKRYTSISCQIKLGDLKSMQREMIKQEEEVKHQCLKEYTDACVDDFSQLNPRDIDHVTGCEKRSDTYVETLMEFNKDQKALMEKRKQEEFDKYQKNLVQTKKQLPVKQRALNKQDVVFENITMISEINMKFKNKETTNKSATTECQSSKEKNAVDPNTGALDKLGENNVTIENAVKNVEGDIEESKVAVDNGPLPEVANFMRFVHNAAPLQL